MRRYKLILSATLAIIILIASISLVISLCHDTDTGTEIETILSTENIGIFIAEDSTDEVQVNQRELNLLAAAIYYEAGSNDCTDRHQQLVAQVILNRVASNEFPDTIYDVIAQNNPTVQYSSYRNILNTAENPDEIPQRCYDNALVAFKGEVNCPSNIVWQSNFKQGSGTYETHRTSYSITYFCYR